MSTLTSLLWLLCGGMDAVHNGKRIMWWEQKGVGGERRIRLAVRGKGEKK